MTPMYADENADEKRLYLRTSAYICGSKSLPRQSPSNRRRGVQRRRHSGHEIAAANPWEQLFGRRLRELRQARDLTHEALAEAADLSGSYISDLELGLKVPSLTILVRLSQKLRGQVFVFLK
jgi:DNA-binding XRE family transcriptional regulator